MSEINKGDLIVVQLRSGMVVLGKLGDEDEACTTVTSPRVLQPTQKGAAIVEFVGRPTELDILRTDIYFLYPNKDGNLIADYIKSTTGLSLASVIPTKQ